MMTTTRPGGLPWVRLRRFFNDRQRVTLQQAAGLLSREPSWVAERLDHIEVPRPEEGLPWEEVAELARCTLTPGELDAVAGRGASFPPLLRVTAVPWRIPLYLLIALGRAVARERLDPDESRLTVEAYVARELERSLDPDVVLELSRDAAFHAAFHYPDTEGGD
jgi:hypothetical protein